MTLEQIIRQIRPVSAAAREAAKEKWDSVAKPLGGLGLLEEAVCRMAAATGSADVHIGRRAVAVFCADNGVVAQGVSQSGSEVTRAVAENLCRATASVSRMAGGAGCDVLPVDVGMLHPLEHPLMRQSAVRRGTGDIALGPAMSRREAVAALETGAALALECRDRGYHLLAAGEAGIGNTTTSAAVAALLLHRPPEEVAGRGAGLSQSGQRRKVRAIRAALARNRPQPEDPVDVLSKVGGLDIAAMCGFYLGAAAAGLPAVLDGLISCTAALCAVRLCPHSAGYLLASHCSDEPAAAPLLEALGLRSVLTAGLRLGEGTGAVALLPLLDLALEVYHTAATFEDCRLQAYTPQEGV